MDRASYESDLTKWAEQQADALRRRASNELDWKNVAEEIEDLGKSERPETESRLAVICRHLLKFVSGRSAGRIAGLALSPRRAARLHE